MAERGDEVARIEAGIAAQEALRPSLGDAVVDAVVDALRARLSSLKAERPAREGLAAAVLERARLLLPKSLARAVLDSSYTGEQRPVAALAVDLAPALGAAEAFEGEDRLELVREIAAELAEAVHPREGLVLRAIGTTAVALFGAPVAHEDDVLRAMRAALAIKDRFARLGARRGRPTATRVVVEADRAGISAPARGETAPLSVTGGLVPAVVAALAHVPEGAVAAGERAGAMSRGAFRFEPLPAGVAFRLERVIGARAVTGLRADSGDETAFVGRERELGALVELMGEVKTGRGQIAFLAGEAGIGKSRLLLEWRRALGDSAHWLEGRAFGHTTSTAFGPILDLIRRAAGIEDEDSGARARAQLDAFVARWLPSQARVAAVLAHLLALPLSDEEAHLHGLKSKIEQQQRHWASTLAELTKQKAAVEDDLRAASRLQRAMLPRMPRSESLQAEAIYRPLEMVGGDLYDVHLTARGQVRVLVADAPGHGLQASLRTMVVKAVYDRSKARSGDPGELLARVNDELVNIDPAGGLRLTAVCFDIDLAPETSGMGARIVAACAAHPPVVILRGGGAIELEAEGSFLGVMPRQVYPVLERELVAGDRVLAYTDGLVEPFGAASLTETPLAVQLAEGALVPALASAASAIDVDRLRDDVTLLGFEYTPATWGEDDGSTILRLSRSR